MTKNTTKLRAGAYMPLAEYARQMREPYARLYMKIRQNRAAFGHYKVGRAHLVRVHS